MGTLCETTPNNDRPKYGRLRFLPPPFAGWGHSQKLANSGDQYTPTLRGMQALAKALLQPCRSALRADAPLQRDGATPTPLLCAWRKGVALFLLLLTGAHQPPFQLRATLREQKGNTFSQGNGRL